MECGDSVLVFLNISSVSSAWGKKSLLYASVKDASSAGAKYWVGRTSTFCIACLCFGICPWHKTMALFVMQCCRLSFMSDLEKTVTGICIRALLLKQLLYLCQ